MYMPAVCLTPANRSTFDELANRDTNLDAIREMFFHNDEGYNKWVGTETELFWVTQKQYDAVLSVWDIINPM